MITFLCSRCNTQHSVPDEWAGQSAQCPCGMKMAVPKIVKLDPASSGPEPQGPENDSNAPEDNESNFNFDPNALSSIPSTTRDYIHRRKSRWIPIAKYLSSAAAAMLLFFCYPYYAPKLDEFFASWKGEPTTTEARADPAQNTNVPQKEPARETDSQFLSTATDKEETNRKTAHNKKTTEGKPSVTKIPKEKKRHQKQPTRPEIPEVTLPSGRTISAQLLSTSKETKVALHKIRDTKHYYQKDQNARICAVCQYDPQGEIDGLAMRIHDNGKMSFLAHFHDSKRSGPMRYWDESEKLVYYSDWINGRKQGTVCLFHDEKPVLLQEWKANKLLSQYLVSYQNPKVPKLEEVTALSEIATPFLKEIAGIESKADDADNQLRKAFSHDFREAVKEIRLQKAAELAPQKRERILQRSAARRLREQAVENTFWQRATTGYLWDTRRKGHYPRAHPIEVDVIPLQ